MIRRGVHKSAQALEREIREWIKAWNDDPRPFVWKKTAEELLDSLCGGCSSMTGCNPS